jgi:DNA replication protein DnaC
MTERHDSTAPPMARIGDLVDFPARLAQIGEARQRYRAMMIARHGWPETVNCPSCGDTGRQPDGGNRPCFCEVGQAIEERERQFESWKARCPRRFREFTLASHPNGDAVAAVHRWLSAGVRRGQNLVLSGPVGTGKTGLAIGALRELHLAGWASRYATVPDMLDAMRPRDRNDPDSLLAADLGMGRLQRVRVLLMDDLGAEKESEWAAERLYLVINGRYERKLPTIVTTNKTLVELRDAVGERAISRLTEDSELVHVGGRDLRRAS